MVTSAFPNHVAWNNSYYTNRFTGDMNPMFAGQSVSNFIFELIRQGDSGILSAVRKEMPKAATHHSMMRLAPAGSRTVTSRNLIHVPKAWYDAYVAQHSQAAADALYTPIDNNVASWRHCFPKIQEARREVGYQYDRLFTAATQGIGSSLVRDMADALIRDKQRDLFAYGFFGARNEGRNESMAGGLTTTAWAPTTDLTTARTSGMYLIDDEGATGLTKAILAKANKWFDSYGYPQSGRHFACTENQKDNLRNIDQLINFDYTSKRYVENNEVPTVEGFKIWVIGSQTSVLDPVTGLAEDPIIPFLSSTNQRRCVAWHEDSIVHVPWGDKPPDMWEDKGNKGSFIEQGTVNAFMVPEDKGMIEIRVTEGV